MAIRVRRWNKRYRSRRGLLAILAAAILGGTSVWAARPAVSLTDEARTPLPARAFDVVRLPVPVSPIEAGTRLEDVVFDSVAFPAHQVPPGAIRDLRPYLGGAAAVSLPARLPLFAENIRIEGEVANPVIRRIPAGMRAMTVRVDATSAVEGWASSGAIVDVLLVRDEGTSVVAEKVEILSAERSLDPVTGASMPQVPSTVTLLVSQDQCLAINTAITLGRIAFALRSNDDEGSWSRIEYQATHLLQREAGREQAGVAGVVKLSDGSTFALSGNTWIRTEVQPEGFLRRGDADDAKE